MSIWLITGTSSGLGTSLVKEVLSRGDKVIATARDVSKITHFKNIGAAVLELDITASQSELSRKAREVVAIYGRIDVLVNNAGYTQFGTQEELGEKYRAQFDTNVFGTINTTSSFLPHFRERRAGTIVNIGSMVSWTTIPTVGAYSASKAALRSVTDALRQEVQELGIKTLLVEPGLFRTELLSPKNSDFVKTGIEDYSAVTEATFKTFRDTHGTQAGDPGKGAARIVDVVKGENGASGREWPAELALGSDAVETIRRQCEERLKLLGEWEVVSGSTDG